MLFILGRNRHVLPETQGGFFPNREWSCHDNRALSYIFNREERSCSLLHLDLSGLSNEPSSSPPSPPGAGPGSSQQRPDHPTATRPVAARGEGEMARHFFSMCRWRCGWPVSRGTRSTLGSWASPTRLPSVYMCWLRLEQAETGVASLRSRG